jgi:photosystem II stability/assembly factor-like uncharacterized protein
MKRLAALLLLVACTHADHATTPTTPPPPPAVHLVASGDWQLATTEPYRGKQDDLYFPSPKVGFYGNGAGKLFRTDDGGATWTKVLDQPGTYWRALGFLDAARGFAGNIGPDYFPGVTDPQLLYRTADGGKTWQPVALPDTTDARGVCAIDILSVDFINAGHRDHKEVIHVGGRVGGPASLYASDDGGATWRRLPLPKQVAMILDVKFTDVSTGFVFAGSDANVETSHGLILKTSDSGRTWRTVYESTRPFELMWKGAFPSRLVGYATLQSYDPTETNTARYVVKTTDGGDTWHELPLIADHAVSEFGVGFVDDQHGWVGAVPQGFETTDGGATWTKVPSMPLAANKLRIVRDPASADVDVWAIGLDVRHVHLKPAARPVDIRAMEVEGKLGR